jgi:dTDP-4-dehydrorhamnose reductase
MPGHYLSVVALVIGASGLVGGALMRSLEESAIGTFRTRPVAGLRYLDALDSPGLAALLAEVRPEIVFFPAAEPNVEWSESEPDAAYRANVVATVQALDAARSSGARFVFFSSDYVFDGLAGPYDENAPTAPVSVYGRHKVETEQRVLNVGAVVIRTTSVDGSEQPPGKNFVLRLISRLAGGETVTIPSDQYSTPTWSAELARGAIAVSERTGIWHVAGTDFLARDRFAAMVAEVFGFDASLIRPVTTNELHQKAARPMYGGLRADKIMRVTGIVFTSTRHALERLAAKQAGENVR